jgi:hypothetical protein
VKENDECHCKYHKGNQDFIITTSEQAVLVPFLNMFDFHHTEGRSRDDRGVKLCRWSHSLTESVAPSEWIEVMGFDQKTLEEKAVLLREEYLKIDFN